MTAASSAIKMNPQLVCVGGTSATTNSRTTSNTISSSSSTLGSSSTLPTPSLLSTTTKIKHNETSSNKKMKKDSDQNHMNTSTQSTTNSVTTKLNPKSSELEMVSSDCNDTDTAQPSQRRHLTLSATKNLSLVLNKCQRPLSMKELEPVEIFVAKAIHEQHIKDVDDTVPSVVTYKALLDAFRFKSDAKLLHKILLALRTSGNGNTLHLLTRTTTSTSTTSDSNSQNTTVTNTFTSTIPASKGSKHARLIHQLVRFHPFGIQQLMEKRQKTLKGTGTSVQDEKTNIEDEFDEKNQNYDIADAHLHLLIALVSANTIFLVPTLNALWYMLTNQKLFDHFIDTSSSQIDLKSTSRTNPPKTAEESENQSITLYHPVGKIQRIHATIATIIRLCPKGGSELYPIISAQSPNRFWQDVATLSYFQQCCIVLQYLPHLRNNMWKSMTDLCLEMDVEIKINNNGNVLLDDEKDKDDNNNVDATSNIVGSSASNSKDIVMAEPKQEHSLTSEEKAIDVIANKLDSLMLLLFEESESYCQNDSSSSTNQITDLSRVIELYEILYGIFEASILITHKSKFVQFLLFHICGLEVKILTNMQQPNNNSKDTNAITGLNDGDVNQTELANKEGTNETSSIPPIVDSTTTGGSVGTLYREFASKLIDIILDPYRATVTRQSSACYLASFVCRASYVCTETVCETIAALIRWAEVYIVSYETNLLNTSHSLYTVADSRDQCSLHSLFYTVCQSAFYIMCFRGYETMKYYNKNVQEIMKNEPIPSEDLLFLQNIDISADRWSKLCSHPLRPLRYCLESVRTEFMHISKLYHLLHDDVLNTLMEEDERRISGLERLDLIKQNTMKRKYGVRRGLSRSRSSLSLLRPDGTGSGGNKIQTASTIEKERLTGGVGGLGQGSNPLDSFFPFDPYLLRVSSEYIEPFYVHWSGTIDDQMEEGNNDDIPLDMDITAATTMIGNDPENVTNDNGVGEGDSINDDDIGDITSINSIDLDGEDDDDSDDNDEETENATFSVKNMLPKKRTFSGDSIQSVTPNGDCTPLSSDNNNNNNNVIGFANGAQHNDWLESMRRPRTPSIENGSW